MNVQSKVEAATLASAMALAFAEIEGATKDRENPAFKAGGRVSKYADINAVIDAIKPALIKHGLFFTQHPQPSEGGVTVETWLHHAGGERLQLGSLFVPANKNDAQGFGSALTYARRYALVTAFGVPVEDDDGNAAAGGYSQRERRDEPPAANGSNPAARQKLAGPITSKTALWAAFKALDHELRGCGDESEFDALVDCKETQALIKQCARDAPQLLTGSEEMPPEFVPLNDLIEQRRADFRQLAEANRMADLART